MKRLNRARSRAGLWACIALAASSGYGCSDDDATSTKSGAQAESSTTAGTGADDAKKSRRTSGATSDDSSQQSDEESSSARAESSESMKAEDSASDGAKAERGSSAAEDKASSSADCGAGEFDSTFAAIQQVIFEGYKCTDSKCHGEAALGGLDLRGDAAYDNLVEAKSKSSSFFRIMPGLPHESFLYNKLLAATEPDSVKVEGSPMPVGGALTKDHLAAMRRWIEAGAPRKGSVGDSITGKSDAVAALLGSCLPEATPIDIKPLAAPDPAEGTQLVMPSFELAAGKEVDVCFAQYVDLSAVVPEEYQDAERGVFFVNGQRVRQDPHSHHFLLLNSGQPKELANDPSYGAWTCRGGEEAGASCDPLDLEACGAGNCASEVQNKGACIGFGPPAPEGYERDTVATAQTAQYYRAPREGLYETFPLRGLLYWNSHAFNLTSQETELNVWVNVFYAKDPQHEVRTVAVTDKIAIAAGQPPFTIKNYCSTWTAPLHAQMYQLSSHTHKRGSNFTVDGPDGKRIYTSAIYSDPVEMLFEPAMVFDSEDPAQRTLTYCADFNNGLTADGLPDTDLVTKLSTMPDRTTCEPVACVSGKIGAPCDGADDDAACDSSKGAGDGSCDACAITRGQTTENEMFVLSPSIVIPEQAEPTPSD